MSEKLEELISLLYQDRLTQYGKRLLVENIEKLQKENEYYKECLEVVSKHLDNIDYDQILFAIYEYYISKQKVKDKIEELNKKEKKELKGMKGQDRYFVKQTYQNKRMILQELIEEREEK